MAPSSSSTSSTLTQPLLTLLPKYAANPSTIPPALLRHAENLLIQSRQRAPHLKPAEEIARTHACCEIACKRLRARLRLPAVKDGGAPCKPAVYRKLVTFLEGVLVEEGGGGGGRRTGGGGLGTPNRGASGGAAGRQSTGSKKRTADGSVKNGTVVRQEKEPTTTPSKTARKEGTFLGKIKASSSVQKQNAEEANGGGDGSAPAYTMPMIRKLCRAFASPSLAPHVYTGVCIVLKFEGLWPVDPDAEVEVEAGAGADNEALDSQTQPDSKPNLQEQTTGLVIALYFMTVTRAYFASKLPSPTIYKSTSKRAVEILAYAPSTLGVSEWIRRVKQQQYADGQEWYENVPERVVAFDIQGRGTVAEQPDGEDGEDEAENGLLSRENEQGEGVDEDEDEDDLITSGRRQRRKVAGSNSGRSRAADLDEEDDPDGVLLPGLHTMMRDALDFLSEERTREFEKWRKQLLLKLDRLDKASPGTPKGGKAVAVK